MAATAGDGSYGGEMAATAERWQLRRRDCRYSGEMAAMVERSQQRRRDGSYCRFEMTRI